MIVEDEPDIRALLEYTLEKEGLRVTGAQTGQQALEHLRRECPDVVVLDRMLPDMDGIEILKKIRASRGMLHTRVLILSAKVRVDDRIEGLELGAHDYLTKPFSPKELVLRIRSVLGQEPAEAEAPETLTVGPIELDETRHTFRLSGQTVHLTLTEFRLLADLIRNAGRVRSREVLMTRVWGYDSEAMSRTVDTHVRRLRAKLGACGSWLETIRGVGYRFRDRPR
jgi:two-component system phosphate regulon response regulator PhoB